MITLVNKIETKQNPINFDRYVLDIVKDCLSDIIETGIGFLFNKMQVEIFKQEFKSYAERVTIKKDKDGFYELSLSEGELSL